MAVDAEVFKQGLRRWASGVTVVTAKSGDRQHGMGRGVDAVMRLAGGDPAAKRNPDQAVIRDFVTGRTGADADTAVTQ